MSGLSVKELRAALKAASINYDGCVEKSDLIALFEKHNLSGAAASTTETEQPAVEIVDAPATAAPATAVPDAAEWAQMSAAKLKKLLVQHGVSVEGCFEKADFLERAEKELGKGASWRRTRMAVRWAGSRKSTRRRANPSSLQSVSSRRRWRRRSDASARRDARPPRPLRRPRSHHRLALIPGGWLICLACVVADVYATPLVGALTRRRRLLARSSRRIGAAAASVRPTITSIVVWKAPGTNNPNEPDMVDEKGVCWKLKVSGGGGARDSPDYTWVQLKGVEPPPKDTKYKRATPQEVQRTGAARADSAALNYTGGTAAIASASAAATAEQSSEAAEEAAARMRAARDID